MKKFTYVFIICLLIPLIASLYIVFKSTNCKAEEGVYVKLAAGVNHIHDHKIIQDEYIGKLKLKRFFPVIGVGAGYDFGDGLRIESLFDYYFLFTQQENGKLNDTSFKLNLDTQISDWVVNIYQAYPLNERSNVFVGMGCGIASIKDEGTGIAKEDGIITVLVPSYGKHVYRFAHRFIGGLEYQLQDNFIAELSYNYLHLGKNKPQFINGSDGITPRQFRVHNITLGLRFKI